MNHFGFRRDRQKQPETGRIKVVTAQQHRIRAANKVERSTVKSGMRIVTLLSDFGTVDGYVGAMKGVILSLASAVQVVDVTHDIPPQDIFSGAWALCEAAPLFPDGTIHVVVVDPGVGTQRRPLLLQSGGQLFVGPDNGVLSLAATEARCWILDRPEMFHTDPSTTFHGRDIFANVAGQLAAGRRPELCGTPTSEWEVLSVPEPLKAAETIQGEVLAVDRFGNLISNIPGTMLEPVIDWTVEVGQQEVGPVRRTYGEVSAGSWLAYVGSRGLLEVAICCGNAARETAGVGSRVRCSRAMPDPAKK